MILHLLFSIVPNYVAYYLFLMVFMVAQVAMRWTMILEVESSNPALFLFFFFIIELT